MTLAVLPMMHLFFFLPTSTFHRLSYLREPSSRFHISAADGCARTRRLSLGAHRRGFRFSTGMAAFEGESGLELSPIMWLDTQNMEPIEFKGAAQHQIKSSLH